MSFMCMLKRVFVEGLTWVQEGYLRYCSCFLITTSLLILVGSRDYW